MNFIINIKKYPDFTLYLTESCPNDWGGYNVLASCVGIHVAGSTFEIGHEVFDKAIKMNLQSAVYLSRKVLPGMVERKNGSIIYLASIAGVRGNKSLGLYGITKAALIQLAKNQAVEFGPYGITVNAISPGVIETGFSAALMADTAFMEKRLQLTPLRRVGQPHEVGGVAAMLAAPAGAFITGQNIIVDGGTTISDGN